MAGIDAKIVAHVDERDEVRLGALTRVVVADATESIALASNDVVELGEAPLRRIDLRRLIEHGS